MGLGDGPVPGLDLKSLPASVPTALSILAFWGEFSDFSFTTVANLAVAGVLVCGKHNHSHHQEYVNSGVGRCNFQVR